MSDLPPDELLGIERSLGGPGPVASSKSETCRMVAEIMRRRAEQQAGQEHVRAVVGRAIMAELVELPLIIDGRSWTHGEAGKLADAIAASLAEQLVPVLSAEDAILLRNLKAEIKEYGIAGTGDSGNATPDERLTYYALLDRLLALCPKESP